MTEGIKARAQTIYDEWWLQRTPQADGAEKASLCIGYGRVYQDLFDAYNGRKTEQQVQDSWNLAKVAFPKVRYWIAIIPEDVDLVPGLQDAVGTHGSLTPAQVLQLVDEVYPQLEKATFAASSGKWTDVLGYAYPTISSQIVPWREVVDCGRYHYEKFHPFGNWSNS